MSDVETVDFALAGEFCLACDLPVQCGELVQVDRDSAGDDGSRTVLRVLHVVYPVTA